MFRQIFFFRWSIPKHPSFATDTYIIVPEKIYRQYLSGLCTFMHIPKWNPQFSRRTSLHGFPCYHVVYTGFSLLFTVPVTSNASRHFKSPLAMGEMPFKIKRASSVPISVVIDTGVNSNVFSPAVFIQLQKSMQNKQIYGMIESKKQKVQEG